MGWSLRVARIAGIDVKVHATFLLLLAWIGLMHYFQGGPAAALESVGLMVLLFACVLLHEFGHALAARGYGIATPDITLLPIGGVARLQRMPDQPHQELVVALAGPAVNVVIAALLYLALGRPAGVGELGQLEDPGTGLLAKLLAVNVMLVLFNLVPAFPMDGGRVLRALLALRLDYTQATQVAASLGQAMAFLFGFLGLFFNPLLIFVALFVYVGAAQEAGLTQMRELSRGLPVSAAMVTEFVTLPVDATLGDAVTLLLRTSQHEFPAVDAVGRVHGVLTRDQLIAGLRDAGPDAPAYPLMHKDLPAVSAGSSFEAAFALMHESGSAALPVLDPQERLVGLITPENVGEMMMVQAALGGRRRPSRGADRQIDWQAG